MVSQLVGIDFNLVLPHVAADRRDFSHAVHGLQRVFDKEILLRPQLGQIHRLGRF